MCQDRRVCRDNASQKASSIISTLSVDDQGGSIDGGYGVLFGVFHGRNVQLRPIEKASRSVGLVESRRGVILDGITGTREVHVYPGDWISMSESYSPAYNVRTVAGMFPVESTEYNLDGRVTINASKYSMIDRILSGRGL